MKLRSIFILIVIALMATFLLNAWLNLLASRTDQYAEIDNHIYMRKGINLDRHYYQGGEVPNELVKIQEFIFNSAYAHVPKIIQNTLVFDEYSTFENRLTTRTNFVNLDDYSLNQIHLTGRPYVNNLISNTNNSLSYFIYDNGRIKCINDQLEIEWCTESYSHVPVLGGWSPIEIIQIKNSICFLAVEETSINQYKLKLHSINSSNGSHRFTIELRDYYLSQGLEDYPELYAHDDCILVLDNSRNRCETITYSLQDGTLKSKDSFESDRIIQSMKINNYIIKLFASRVQVYDIITKRTTNYDLASVIDHEGYMSYCSTTNTLIVGRKGNFIEGINVNFRYNRNPSLTQSWISIDNDYDWGPIVRGSMSTIGNEEIAFKPICIGGTFCLLNYNSIIFINAENGEVIQEIELDHLESYPFVYQDKLFVFQNNRLTAYGNHTMYECEPENGVVNLWVDCSNQVIKSRIQGNTNSSYTLKINGESFGPFNFIDPAEYYRSQWWSEVEVYNNNIPYFKVDIIDNSTQCTKTLYLTNVCFSPNDCLIDNTIGRCTNNLTITNANANCNGDNIVLSFIPISTNISDDLLSISIDGQEQSQTSVGEETTINTSINTTIKVSFVSNPECQSIINVDQNCEISVDQLNPQLSYAVTTCPNNDIGAFLDPRDGNFYRCVQIGDQVWMADNLRYKGNNNQNLGEVYCNYLDDEERRNCHDQLMMNQLFIESTFGRLYDETEILNNNICPPGFRIPTFADFEELVQFAGGEQAGVNLKSASHWNVVLGISNLDIFGFNMTPNGFKIDNRFQGLKSQSTLFYFENSANTLNSYTVKAYESQNNISINGEYPRYQKFGCRCIKI